MPARATGASCFDDARTPDFTTRPAHAGSIMLREREMPPDIELRPETPPDSPAVERLYAVAFGPGRYARTAFRLRIGVAPDPDTSFVAVRRGLVIGAVRQVTAHVAGVPAYLCPLAVAETAAKQGIGRALLTASITAADQRGACAVVLIGDAPFYGPFGFVEVPSGAIWLDAPAEPHRLLFRTAKGANMPSGRLIVGPWPRLVCSLAADRDALRSHRCR